MTREKGGKDCQPEGASDLRFVAPVKSFPLQANRRSFDSGAQKQRACAQDDNSKSMPHTTSSAVKDWMTSYEDTRNRQRGDGRSFGAEDGFA